MTGKEHKWTPEQIQGMKDLYAANNSLETIAKRTGASYGATRRILLLSGMQTRSHLLTVAEDAEITKIYQAGYNTIEIARAYTPSYTLKAITNAIKRQGIPFRDISERHRQYQLNPHVFDVIDNEAAAYFLGFIYADGHVTKNSTLSVSLQAADKNQLIMLRDFLQSDSRIADVPAYDTRPYPQCRLDVSDNHMADKLREWGITVGRLNSQAVIDSIPEHLYAHWLRGAMDGDGCVYMSKADLVIYFMAQEPVLVHTRAMLAKHAGCNPNLAIFQHGKSPIYYIRYYGNRAASAVGAYLYKDATIFMERKHRIYKNAPMIPNPYSLPPGRWTLKYKACTNCGTTEIPHGSHGLCKHCFNRVYKRPKH